MSVCSLAMVMYIGDNRLAVATGERLGVQRPSVQRQMSRSNRTVVFVLVTI